MSIRGHSSIALETMRRLSSSTLVSEEWVLCRENASLSRELTDDVVDMEMLFCCALS